MKQSEPTLIDFLTSLWSLKFFIIMGALLGAVLAFLLQANLTPHYKARMIVGPANPINGAEVSSLLANDNLFALRYLFQRVGMANAPDFMRFENIYDGPSVANILLQDQAILNGLSQVKPYGFMAAPAGWNGDRLSKYLAQQIKIMPMGASPMREMVYYHPNPEFAPYMLRKIHQISDALIRTNIRADAEQRVIYLNQAISETRNPDHRRALTTLLLEQERLKMLVSIDDAYAATIIEPASVSYKPLWPNPVLMYGVMIILGAFLAGLMGAFLRSEPISHGA